LTGPNFDELDIGGDAKTKQVNFRQQKWEYLAVLIAGNANVERYEDVINCANRQKPRKRPRQQSSQLWLQQSTSSGREIQILC
jgi:hypothetical protein